MLLSLALPQGKAHFEQEEMLFSVIAAAKDSEVIYSILAVWELSMPVIFNPNLPKM